MSMVSVEKEHEIWVVRRNCGCSEFFRFTPSHSTWKVASYQVPAPSIDRFSVLLFSKVFDEGKISWVREGCEQLDYKIVCSVVICLIIVYVLESWQLGERLPSTRVSTRCYFLAWRIELILPFPFHGIPPSCPSLLFLCLEVSTGTVAWIVLHVDNCPYSNFRVPVTFQHGRSVSCFSHGRFPVVFFFVVVRFAKTMENKVAPPRGAPDGLSIGYHE